MKKIFRSGLVALWLALFAAHSALAGWAFEDVSRGVTTRVFIQENRIRIQGPDQITILDVGNNTAIYASSSKKTFWKGSPEEYAAAIDGITEKTLNELAQRLEDLPDEIRDQVLAEARQKLAERKLVNAPRVAARPGQGAEMILGHSVSPYRVTVDGRKTDEIWIARDIPVHKDLDLDRFGAMMRTISESMGRKEAYAAYSPEVMEVLKKGWPLRWVSFTPGGGEDRDETRKAEEKDVAPALFLPPEGYREMPLEYVFAP